MSEARKEIEDNEIIESFEFYLKNWCKKHHANTIVVFKDKRKIFQA